MRRCPLFDCTEDLPDTLFACRRHWFMLNRTQQQTIHAAYDDYVANIIGIERLREVQQEIIDAVHAKKGK
jgi:hypothetical protein